VPQQVDGPPYRFAIVNTTCCYSTLRLGRDGLEPSPCGEAPVRWWVQHRMAIRGRGTGLFVADRFRSSDDARGWGLAAWAAWAMSLAGGIAASLLVAFLVTWKAGPNCGDVATSANARRGLTGLGTDHVTR
jgi:hypothetical protein